MTIQDQAYTQLIVAELITTLEQSLTVSSTTVLERVMPHLYIQGTPTGTIRLQVKKGSTVASELTLNLATIISQAEKTKANYHGYISFQFSKPPILKADTYTIELAAVTYSYTSNVFVGWVKRPSSADQTDPIQYPHDLFVVEIRAP